MNRKWKKEIGKAMGFFFAVFTAFMITGCQESREEEEEVLTVCVDHGGELFGQIADNWKYMDEGIKVELVEIPSDETAAETRIKELRTEIMSGGGPDVFIFGNRSGPKLFENPEKAMYSDTFLPLDDYMNAAEYMKPEEWNQVILESGRTGEGQILLPLEYTFPAFAFQSSYLADPGEIPSSTEELLSCEDPLIGESAVSLLYQITYSLSELADYQQETLFYSEEELQKRVEEIVSYDSKWSPDSQQEGIVACGEVNGTFFSDIDRNSQEEQTVFAYPNDQGGVTACVQTYAAVNRNTEKPEQAFSLLDFLLSNEVLSGQGFPCGEDKWAGRNNFFVSGTGGISVNQTVAQKMCRSQISKDALQKMNRQITAVRYNSQLDSEIDQLCEECLMGRMQQPEYEAERKEAVTRTYERMKMQLSE